MDLDREFYERRAAEEERAAERAIGSEAQELHRELASRYRAKLKSEQQTV